MRLLLIALLGAALSSCTSYEAGRTDGQHDANYARVFREPVPPDVTVLNSRVVSFKAGSAAADDFEFEMLVPAPWIAKTAKGFYLRKGEGEYLQKEMNVRRSPARPWYAPKPLDQYELYRDQTGAGRQVHMLAEKASEPDGRQRVFISRH